MGRPPLNVTAVHIRLKNDSLAAIDELVGPFQRPQFIREAVENEIARRIGGSKEPDPD
ncbi:hypothetical protein [Pararhizobium gei]|uniref:hypothetical protein n=1 Tax=Pararhizobium gei TaxID=1395951 RepID=UPI0023DBF9AC|nr:hypothetical protein [Rhizobium gei]